MLIQFIVLLLSVIINSVLCEDSNSVETKYIDLLPENEKKQFLERVARRIIHEVKSKPNNQLPGEIDDRQLDVHSKYVAQVLKEEKERQERIRGKSTEKKKNSRKQNEKKDQSGEKIHAGDKANRENGDAADHIDLTLREKGKNETNEVLKNVTIQAPLTNETKKPENGTNEKEISIEITIDEKSEEKQDQIPVQVIYDVPPQNKNILKTKPEVHLDKTRRADIMDMFTSDAPVENDGTVVDNYSPESSSENESCGDEGRKVHTRTTTRRTTTKPLTTTTVTTTTELDTKTKPYLEPIEDSLFRSRNSSENSRNNKDKPLEKEPEQDDEPSSEKKESVAKDDESSNEEVNVKTSREVTKPAIKDKEDHPEYIKPVEELKEAAVELKEVNLAEAKPVVADNIKLADDKPKAAIDKQDDESGVANDEPKLTDSHLKEPDDKLQVSDDKPKIPVSEPSVANDKPKLTENHPKVTNDKLQVSRDKSKLPDDEPKVANDEPKVTENPPKVTNDNLQVSDDKPKILDDEPKVANHKPNSQDNKQNVAHDKPKVEDGKSNIDRNSYDFEVVKDSGVSQTEVNETTIAPLTTVAADEFNDTIPLKTEDSKVKVKSHKSGKLGITENPKVVFVSADITWKSTLTTTESNLFAADKKSAASIESVEMPKPKVPPTKEPSPTRTTVVNIEPVTFKPIANIAEAIVSRSSYSLGNYLNSLQENRPIKHRPGLRSGMIIKSQEDVVDSKTFQKVMKESGTKGYHVYEIPPDKDLFKSADKVTKLKQPQVARSGPNIENPYYVPIHSYDPENAFFNPHNRFGPNFDDREEHINLEDDPEPFSVENRDDEGRSGFDDKDALREGFSFDDDDDDEDDFGDEGVRIDVADFLPIRHEHLYNLKEADRELLREIFFQEKRREDRRRPLIRLSDLLDKLRTNDYSYYRDTWEIYGHARNDTKTPKKIQIKKTLKDYLNEGSKSAVDWMWDYADRGKGKGFDKVKKKVKETEKQDPEKSADTIKRHNKKQFVTAKKRQGQYDIDIDNIDRPYRHRISYDHPAPRSLASLILRTQQDNDNKNTDWQTLQELTEMVDAKDVFPIMEEALTVPKLQVEPYVKVTRDMINGDKKGLMSYDWLSTAVDVQSAVKKLKDLTDLIRDGGKINKLDFELYKYILYIFGKAKSEIDNDILSLKLRKSNDFNFKANERLLSLLANFKQNNIMMSIEEQMEQFDEFLDELTLGVDDLHDAIKHVALISNWKNRKWFRNLKDLYLNKPSRRRVLEVLLHLSAVRIVDLWENSSKNGASTDHAKYVEENQEEVSKTISETAFVLQVLKELKKLKNVPY